MDVNRSNEQDELDIGIAEIDVQHRQLRDALERLRSCTDKRYGYAANLILAELAVQTRVHFAVEESLMRLLAFPGRAPHLAEHRKLTEQLAMFRAQSQDFDVSDQFSSFLQTWLIDHVKHFDRHFVAHFISKGIDPKAAPEAE